MKKIISLFLVLASLLAFYGCSGGTSEETTQQTDTTQVTETEPAPETSILEALPVENLNGMTFRMLGVSYPTRRNFSTEEESGEVVNDALAKRDLTVSERLQIVIKTQAEDKANTITKNVRDSVAAGDDICDMMITDIAGSLMALMTADSLYDMRQMKHLSLDQNWWSYGMYENASINGKQYITMGDISPMKYYAPYCLAYNLTLAKNSGYTDLYDEVLSGKWTVDMFLNIIRDINRDLDGDGDIDKSDFLGYAHVSTKTTAWSHYTGAGQKLSSTDANGNIVISIGSEESIKVLEKCREIMGCTPDFTAQNNPTSAMFKEDRALFFGNSYASIIADFRDMESDFSVIPTPKWDEEQENYYSCINTWALGGVGVPATCKTPDTVGLIMETLGRVSYMEVRPALYETTIKAKVARDERNAQVLDIIFDNTYIDCNGIFNIGNSANVLGESIMGQSEFASSYAAVRDKIQAGIDDLMKIGK